MNPVVGWRSRKFGGYFWDPCQVGARRGSSGKGTQGPPRTLPAVGEGVCSCESLSGAPTGSPTRGLGIAYNTWPAMRLEVNLEAARFNARRARTCVRLIHTAVPNLQYAVARIVHKTWYCRRSRPCIVITDLLLNSYIIVITFYVSF
jgi:hypothetical protein